VFENRVLRRISGPKREEVAGGWRRLHKDEMGVACCTHGRDAYKILVGKPERKRPLGRPGREWEDNIRMNLREIEWEGVNRIHLVQDRDQRWALVNTVMNLLVP
jgi:hypothetical protein